MAYCTVQHIKDRKGEHKIAQLTGDATGGTVNEPTVEEAINSFAEKMDASIRKQHPGLPFDSSNKYLRDLNIEGAYLLLERDSERGWTDEYRSDWKLLESQLKDIATGLVELKTLEGEALEGFFSSKKRLFGRNSLSGV